MPPDPDSHNPLHTRVQRLEEALGFAQHETEQLAGEVRSLVKLVIDLTRRLEALDQRLHASEAAAARSPEGPDADPLNERPPHSAPPLRREGP